MAKINVVLFKPEIAGNTANIIRTCVGLDANLHLIKPYGFDLNLSEKVFKRGSTNYMNLVSLYEYDSFDHFVSIIGDNNLNFITRYGDRVYSDIEVEESYDNIYYIFGSESSGIDKDILLKYKESLYRLPIIDKMRSLNLANCVMTICYDGARKQNFVGLEKEEVIKKNFLKE